MDPHVLYIDDDHGLRRLAARALQRRGFRVTTADGGAPGLALAEREPFDLVAVDHYMPGMDGLATLEALQQHIAVGMRFHGASVKREAAGLLRVFGEHEAVFRAIAAREAGRARDLMREHLAGSRERLFEHMGDSNWKKLIRMGKFPS